MGKDGTPKKCESDLKIREYLRGKYVLLLYNQIRFATDSYFHESAVKEARVAYIPVSS